MDLETEIKEYSLHKTYLDTINLKLNPLQIQGIFSNTEWKINLWALFDIMWEKFWTRKLCKTKW